MFGYALLGAGWLVVLLPVILVHTARSYWVFRGRVRDARHLPIGIRRVILHRGQGGNMRVMG